MTRLLAVALTCWAFAFLLVAKGNYLPGLAFAAIGAVAMVLLGVLLPTDEARDALRRNHTRPDRRA